MMQCLCTESGKLPQVSAEFQQKAAGMVDEVMGVLLKENIDKAAVEHRTVQATARALAAARLAQQRQARGQPVARPVQALAPPSKASFEEEPTGLPTDPPTSLHHADNTKYCYHMGHGLGEASELT